MKQVIDRRFLHRTELLHGVVREVFQQDGLTYLSVFIPSLGVTLPFVKTALPSGTSLNDAQSAYPVGKKVSVFKKAGIWFVE
ncbi:hypothetical protein phiFa_76 [Thermus phage phiFa]|nr:hypothetical protein phiFa_76 [Thermus phage phiFa]